jgi:hypothetical protein
VIFAIDVERKFLVHGERFPESCCFSSPIFNPAHYYCRQGNAIGQAWEYTS